MVRRGIDPALAVAAAQYAENVGLAEGYLRGRGVTEETAKAFQLGVVAVPVVGHEWFTGRLSLPYLTRNGITQMKFRAMNGEEPKYAGLPGVRPHLYNTEALFDDKPYCAVVEGELDAIILTQCGIPAVGCPGVSVWQDHFPRLFTGYDRVLIFADGDVPGREFARRVADDLDNAVVIALPDSMDATDVYVRDGADALLERAGLAE